VQEEEEKLLEPATAVQYYLIQWNKPRDFRS